ncbi:hypothetical protein BC629DRAFT_1499954 [Irpex lacteus]|nr:hypothetical protein BC629DRAFT_1499954 [Irpex lacteus]
MSVATQFGPPFDDEDADLVIRSSDKVEFRVFKLFLRKGSSVFEGMFTLPPYDTESAVPAVDVSENGQVMAQLLRLCYPLLNPLVTSLDEARILLTACQKYEMEIPAVRLVGIISRTFLATHPFQVYVLACGARATEEARVAAFNCLSIPLGDIIHMDTPDARDVSMMAYRNLLRYHDTCREATVAVLSQRSGVYRSFPWLGAQVSDTYCWAHGCGSTTNYIDVLLANQAWKRFAPWFCELIDSIIAHLQHKAAPMSPKLFEFIDPPKHKMCDACKSGYAISLYRFFSLLDEELKRRVKAVEFNVIF